MPDKIFDLCLLNTLVRGIRAELCIETLNPLDILENLGFNLIILHVITVPILHTLEAHTASA